MHVCVCARVCVCAHRSMSTSRFHRLCTHPCVAHSDMCVSELRKAWFDTTTVGIGSGLIGSVPDWSLSRNSWDPVGFARNCSWFGSCCLGLTLWRQVTSHGFLGCSQQACECFHINRYCIIITMCLGTQFYFEHGETVVQPPGALAATHSHHGVFGNTNL